MDLAPDLPDQGVWRAPPPALSAPVGWALEPSTTLSAEGPRCSVRFVPASGESCLEPARGEIVLLDTARPALPVAGAGLHLAAGGAAALGGGDPFAACRTPESGGAGETLYVASDGKDSNPGTALEPLGDLQRAIDRLTPGDTLVVQGGTYRADGLSIRVQGRGEAPIRIVGAPDQTVRLDGSVPEFQEPGNAAWAPVAPDIQLYRSTRTYGPGDWQGKIEVDGRPIALNVYQSLDAIGATSSAFAPSGDYYLGPGLYYDEEDGHLYIRLQSPAPEALDGRALTGVADPDPRHSGLDISNRSTGLLFDGARHVIVEGLTLAGYRRPVFVKSGGDLAIRNVTMAAGRTGVLIDDGVSNIALEHLTVEGGFPFWISWRDVKGAPRAAAGLKLGGVILRDASCVRVADSRFIDLFDGIVAAGRPSRLQIVHNEFDRVVDDALQLGTGAAFVEFGHNLVFGPGPSHHGSGSSPAPGTKYIHHNVIHIRDPELYARLGQGEIAWRHHIPFANHNMKKAGPDPWKLYNNTVLFHANTNRAGAGQNRKGPRSAEPHEVYNNIFVQQSDSWAARQEQVDDGAEILDGNLYFQLAPDPRAPLFHAWQDGQSEQDFRSLTEFRSSAFAESTRRYYPAGWEAQGVQADPRLGAPEDRDYRPAADGPAATGAVDLAATGWPDADDGGFRGAVDPDATRGVGTVGVRPRPAAAAGGSGVEPGGAATD